MQATDFPLMQWDLAFTRAHVAGKRLCALLTNRRSFYSQRTGAGLKSEASTVIEMILSAYIAHGSQQVGHDAACVADEAESASATTFTRVPHSQRHNATILVMITSTFSNSMHGFYACKNCRNLRCCEETGHKPGACSGVVATEILDVLSGEVLLCAMPGI